MEVGQPQFRTNEFRMISKCNISGHGEHKRTTHLGKKELGENEKEKVVAQKEVLGDVLVSVTGQ